MHRWTLCSWLAIGFVLASALSVEAHDWNGIAIDAEQRLYVVDAEDGQIWSIDAKGKVAVCVPGATDAKSCRHAHHVLVDESGLLWIPSG